MPLKVYRFRDFELFWPITAPFTAKCCARLRGELIRGLTVKRH